MITGRGGRKDDFQSEDVKESPEGSGQEAASGLGDESSHAGEGIRKKVSPGEISAGDL